MRALAEVAAWCLMYYMGIGIVLIVAEICSDLREGWSDSEGETDSQA